MNRVNLCLLTQEREGKQRRGAGRGGCQTAGLRRVMPLGVVIFVLTLFVYYRTLEPSVGDWGDSAKFQLVAHVLGIPHATGYPLYVSLAKIFTLFPIRDVAFRVNLLSAVSAAAAVALLCLVIWVLTRDLVAAGGAALLFAWSKTFWSQAVIAEVYSLNAAFVALVILLLFLWRARGGLWLYVGALAVYALSLGNHASMILLAPALLWFVGMTDRRMLSRPRTLAFAAGILTLGACQYLLLYLRARQHPAFCECCPDTLSRLWWYLTGAQFRSKFFAFSWMELGRRIASYGSLLVAEYGLVSVVAGLLGTVVLGMRRRCELIFLALVFLANVLFTMSYDIVDLANFLIPSYLIFAIWIGCTLTAITRWIAQMWQQSHRLVWKRALSGVWTLVVVGLALRPFQTNYAIVDESNNRAAREEVTALLELMAEDAVLVLPPCCDFYSRAMATLYLQQVEGMRPDVAMVAFRDDEDGMVARPSFTPQGEEEFALLEENEGSIQAAYLPQVGAHLMSGLEDQFVLRPVDSSTTLVSDLLNGLPTGSIIILASRQPVHFSVDERIARTAVEAAIQELGFHGVRWPGYGAHILIGVRGAEPGTAVEVWNPQSVQVLLRAGQPIGTTGTSTRVSLRVLSSSNDADIVVANTNVSPHHWGYNLVVLEPGSGNVMLAVHFNTETFLVNNVRAYRVVAVR